MQRNEIALNKVSPTAVTTGPERRVLYVIGSMGVGGAEQQLLTISEELVRRGWCCEVFALNPLGPLRLAFEAAGVPVIGIELPAWVRHVMRRPRALGKLLQLMLTAPFLWWHLWHRKPRIIHYFLPGAYIVGGIVSIFGPHLRRIMSRRSLNLYQVNYPLCGYLERWLHSKMDLVCGNSRAVLADLATEGVRLEQMRLIYNGVATHRFLEARSSDAVRSDLGVPRDALVFIMVANLIAYKGHADLIDALGQISDQLPQPWVCLCAGRDDGIGDSLRVQIDRLGLNERVRFLGSRADITDLLSASDIGVLCSLQEGFSNAILEGMAAGLPMVVTDVGGNAEAVVQGETGIVVPPGKPELLAEALLAMAQDAQRADMGVAGTKRVKAFFSTEACVKAHEELYRI